MNSQFIAAMEKILWLYSLPYDPKHPLICFDERPCFLIGDVIDPLPLQSSKVARQHYAYERHGSCALLAAIEPLTGRRLAHLRKQRTKKEFTQFCCLLAASYPKAEKIHLVLDNLNTHKLGSFYDHLPADEAWALAQRFQFHFTPKSASWLNMIEIEFSALARRCLNRRIPTMAEIESEVTAFFDRRTQERVKINWQFSIDDCREKLNSKYAIVNDANLKFADT